MSLAVELYCLLTADGLAYGIDASLRRLVPTYVARLLVDDHADAELDGPKPVDA